MLSRRDIDPKHRELFLGELKKINEYFPLDMLEVTERLATLKWPKTAQSAYMLAVKGVEANKFLPFQVVAGLCSPPSDVSKDAPIMELRVMNTRTRSSGNIDFPVSLCVFSSGRRVLYAGGAVLDSAGRLTKYQSGEMAISRLELQRHPALVSLLQRLVADFELSQERTRELQIKQQALNDLNIQLTGGQG